MITIKGLGKFLVVSYDKEKTLDIDKLITQNKTIPLSLFSISNITYLFPTSVSIDFSRERLLQNCSISLPYESKYIDPTNIFKIVEVWFYDENNNSNGICLFRGLVKNIKVSERAGGKEVNWECEDVLSWLEYYTTIYYKEKVEINIKQYLEDLIANIGLFFGLQMWVDDSEVSSIFLGRLPLVSLDRTNAMDNIQKYINQTAHKIFYNPRKNAITISSMLYIALEERKVYKLSENNVVNVDYDVFSNYFVGVRVNTIKVGYSFMKEKLDDYETVVVYDPFLVDWKDIESGRLSGRILDIWIEPQTSRSDMINIAKERFLQIVNGQKVSITLIPTKESFEMWLGDWVEWKGVTYYINEIRYEISPSNISINLGLKKFLTFELGQEIRSDVKFWDKKYIDTFWDKPFNEEAFD